MSFDLVVVKLNNLLFSWFPSQMAQVNEGESSGSCTALVFACQKISSLASAMSENNKQKVQNNQEWIREHKLFQKAVITNTHQP